MKRDKLFVILAIITAISLFITAATCNFCGIQLDTAPSEEESIPGSDKQDSEETTSKETEYQAETTEEQTTEQTVEDETAAEETEPETEDEAISEEASIIVLEDINSLAGFVESNGTAHQGNRLFIGDDNNNVYTMGYISFDISSLSNIVIDSATLKMSISAITGNPAAFSEHLSGFIYNYGNDLNIEDLNTNGTFIGEVHLAGRVAGDVLEIAEPFLKPAIQMVINNSEDKFQIKFRLSNYIGNNDEIQDGIWLDSNNIKLEVTTE